MNATEKQSQFINVQCYAFSVSPLGDALRRSPQDSGQRQGEETVLQNKANFIGVQMGAALYSKKDYDSEPCRRLQKNKANRQPFVLRLAPP